MSGSGKRIKKMLAIGAIAFSTSLLATSANAATAIELLQEIVNYTYYAAEGIYYIQLDLLAQLNSWIMPDTSESTSKLQGNFTTLTNSTIKNATEQLPLQTDVTMNFLENARNSGIDTTNFAYQALMDKNYAAIEKKITEENKKRKEGAPPPKPADPALNYIRNVSGMNILHAIPSDSWIGSKASIDVYKRFYNTISSVQTYDAYILSELYTEAKSDNPSTKQQNDLMQMASNSSWFTEIASESIGTVLRQILMFNSQTYVLMTQLLRTQKQLLTTAAMTNTLLVLGNQFTENQLITDANTAPR